MQNIGHDVFKRQKRVARLKEKLKQEMNFVVKEAQRQEKKKENWSSSNGDALLLKNNKVTTAF